jgi:hypothetical protein
MLCGPILDILRADDAMNGWFVFVIDLLGVGALTLHGYDVEHTLISIAFGWFAPGALLLSYRGGHLLSRGRACSLHIGAMQTMARRFDIGVAGAMTSCPSLSG